MKPSQVASKLRQIATAIDNSKSPRVDLVVEDLKRIAGGIDAPDPFDPTAAEGHASGSDYDLNIKFLQEAGDDIFDRGYTYEVKGTAKGNPIDGQVVIFIEDGEYSGWDWMSDSEFDLTIDENADTAQTVLDCFEPLFL